MRKVRTRRMVFGIILSLILISVVLGISSKSEVESSYDKRPLNTAVLPTSSGSAEVRYDPQTYTFITERGVDVGYRFNTTIKLCDVTGLFAWQVRVYFNNTILKATNAYYHADEPIHSVSHVELAPVIDNDYNTTHGYVQLGISAIYPSYVNVTTGDYPLGVGICIMEFEVLMKPPSRTTATSGLTLDNPDTRLRKDPSTIIPCTKKDGLYRLISATIRVPTDYSTIQAAINAADTGNTIFVYNGTYYENVVVNKTIMLFGQSAESVVINGSAGTVMHVENADNVVVDGFTLACGSYGVDVYDSSLDTISNNIIRGNAYDGIFGHSDPSSREHCNDLSILENNITLNGNSGIHGYSYKHYWYGSETYCDNWIVSNNSILLNSGNGMYAEADEAGHLCGWMVSCNHLHKNGGDGIYAYEHWSSAGSSDDWLICFNTIDENVGNGIDAIAQAYGPGMSRWGFNNWLICFNFIETNGGSGIYAHGSQWNWFYYSYCIDWSISSNNITDNAETGISVSQYDDNWIILNNCISLNHQGVYISYGNHILRSNKMSHNDYNFGVNQSYVQDVDSSNTVDGKPIYYLTHRNGGQVPADAGYVALVDSANVAVANLYLSNNEEEIAFVRTENCTLANISVTNSVYGVYLQEASNFTGCDSQAANNTYGIYLQDCANCSFSNNRAMNNTYGVYLANTVNCTLFHNEAIDNTYGIYCMSSVNCNITDTDLETNAYGIYLFSSSNDTFRHNNFNQNNHQAATHGTCVNSWNDSYPSGGNYWSNHTGPDWLSGIYQNETGSDGIVDTNMTIGQHNVDYYPLSAPWSTPIHIIIPGNTLYREYNTTLGSANISLTFTIDFTPSWIGYSLDGHPNVTTNGNVTLANLACGYHRVTVYANDTARKMHSSLEVHFAITYLTDINYDKTVDIDDLVNTTWRYGSIPGDTRWNVYADVNRDGIIDIDDIALVVRDYGKTVE